MFFRRDLLIPLWLDVTGKRLILGRGSPRSERSLSRIARVVKFAKYIEWWNPTPGFVGITIIISHYMIWNATQFYALKLVLLFFSGYQPGELLKRVCHRSASALIKCWRVSHCAYWFFHGSTGKKSVETIGPPRPAGIPLPLCYLFANVYAYIYTEIHLHIRFRYLLRDQNISPSRIPPWKKKEETSPLHKTPCWRKVRR